MYNATVQKDLILHLRYCFYLESSIGGLAIGDAFRRRNFANRMSLCFCTMLLENSAHMCTTCLEVCINVMWHPYVERSKTTFQIVFIHNEIPY